MVIVAAYPKHGATCSPNLGMATLTTLLSRRCWEQLSRQPGRNEANNPKLLKIKGLFIFWNDVFWIIGA